MQLLTMAQCRHHIHLINTLNKNRTNTIHRHHSRHFTISSWGFSPIENVPAAPKSAKLAKLLAVQLLKAANAPKGHN
jgi:hypothetical protein